MTTCSWRPLRGLTATTAGGSRYESPEPCAFVYVYESVCLFSILRISAATRHMLLYYIVTINIVCSMHIYTWVVCRCSFLYTYSIISYMVISCYIGYNPNRWTTSVRRGPSWRANVTNRSWERPLAETMQPGKLKMGRFQAKRWRIMDNLQVLC